MVRKTNMAFLTKLLAQKSLGLTSRTAGQFSEAYTNIPSRLLKKFVYALNVFYFKFVRLPQPAIGNILFFRKTSSGRVALDG